MEIIKIPIGKIKPYKNNPRKNNGAVDAVAESIRQCEYIAPIILDENNIVLAGHTRLKALKKLGYKEAECVVKTGLTEEQKKKYRLLDNKTNELASWDFDLLMDELEGLDFEGFDFGFDTGEEELPAEEDEIYTNEIGVPQYEPSLEGAELSECVDTEKADGLIEEINKSKVSEEEKAFLRLAAARHYEFTYKKIADYYASASEEMQELMEKSALVIIDYNDAIKNGYAELKGKVRKLLDEEGK